MASNSQKQQGFKAMNTKSPMPTEHEEQVALIEWFRLQYRPLADNLFAIPNGGQRHKATAAKLKAEGVLAGVSDLMLMVRTPLYSGLFIEMKRKDGKATAPQLEFIERAREQGFKAEVAKGFDEAKKIIENYLNPF